ncbi:MAG: molybdopterin oxidoreductase family protein [Janthinobacterium lividum]
MADSAALDRVVTTLAGAGTTGTATHCPYCALQCGMMLNQDMDGAWSVSARDFPTNKGGLCRKGWTAAALLDHPERLTTPLVRDRKGGPLRPASWDEALDRIVAGIQRIQATHGPNAMAVFGGGGLTNEKAYLLGKFARLALRTGNIDYNGRFCMASAAAAGLRAFGIDRGLPFPLEDIPGAETILIAGSNPAETMPPIMQYFEAQRARGGKLIVSDPRRTATAKLADLHLALTPGTDAALANGILNAAIRAKLIDPVFIAERTTGWPATRRSVASYWPDRVERLTGVPARDIERAAHMLGEAATAMILSGRGPEQQSQGTNNALAFINLALALGQAGRKHCGWGCMTGQGNGQGGREHGQKNDQLPGYRKLDDPGHRAAVARVWGVDPDTLPMPGMPAVALLQSLGQPGGVQGLMVAASNLVVSAPDAASLAARLSGLDMFVALDLFLTETSSLADIVLPVPQWAEEGGTMTNLEGRVIQRIPARDPPPGVWSEPRILSELASRLGCVAAFPSEPAEAFTELRRASAGGVADYAGMAPDRIAAKDGLFWPCPDEAHPGTPRLFLDRFAHPDGRARFHPVERRLSAEEPDDAYPLYLTTGRVLTHYQSGAQTRRVAELQDAEPAAFVELHPDTARPLGILPGTLVQVSTRRGSVKLAARVTADIRRDTLFVPFHWGGASNANLLTIDTVDPISRMPELKICAARIAVASAEAAPVAAS